jgi:hypothetical protein
LAAWECWATAKAVPLLSRSMRSSNLYGTAKKTDWRVTI